MKNGTDVVINLAKGKFDTALHEVTHVLEKTKDYVNIKESVLELSKTTLKPQADKIRGMYEEDARKRGIEYTKELEESEIVAGLMKEIVKSPDKFMKDIKGNKSLLEKLKEMLKGMLEKVKVFAPTSEVQQIRKAYNSIVEALKLDNSTPKRDYTMSANAKGKLQKNTTQKGAVQFSIVDGVVVIDTDQYIFEGVEKSEYGKIAREYIKTRYKGAEIKAIKINKISASEYTYSEYTKKLYNKNAEVYEAKMKLSTEFINLIKTGKFIKNESARHEKSYNIDGYDRYKINFVLDDVKFLGEMLVAKNGNQALFYDVVNIKKATSTNPLNGRQDATYDELSSNTIIRNSPEKVNSKNENILEKNNKTQYLLSGIDKFSEKQYNDYAWAQVNEVLRHGEPKTATQSGTFGEIEQFNKKFSELKRQKGQFPQTASGEHMLSVENKIVYVSGTFQSPKISQVLEITAKDGDELAVVMTEIFIAEKRGEKYERFDGTIENFANKGNIIRYTRKDWFTFAELKRQASLSAKDNSRYWNGKPRGYNFEESDGRGGENDKSGQPNLAKTDKTQYSLKFTDIAGYDKVATAMPKEELGIRDALLSKKALTTYKDQKLSKVKAEYEGIQIAMVNAQAGLERMMKEHGMENPSYATNFVRAGKSAAANMVTFGGGQYDLQGKNRLGDSLGDIFKDVYDKNKLGDKYLKDKVKYTEYEKYEGYYGYFGAYLYHNHNIDRMAQGKPVFGEEITAEISKAEIERFNEAYPEFAETAQRVWKYLDNLLQMRVGSGLISKKYAEQLREMYPHYVPTFRLEKIQGNSGQVNSKYKTNVKQTIGKATGSDLKLMPIDESIKNQTMQVVQAARLNKMLLGIYRKSVQSNNYSEFVVQVWTEIHSHTRT